MNDLSAAKSVIRRTQLKIRFRLKINYSETALYFFIKLSFLFIKTLVARFAFLRKFMDTHTHITASEPWEQKLHSAIKLYIDYGKFGKNLISNDAEQKITPIINKLGCFPIAQIGNQKSIDNFVIDPTNKEEIKRLAFRFYELVIMSLPDREILETPVYRLLTDGQPTKAFYRH